MSKTKKSKLQENIAKLKLIGEDGQHAITMLEARALGVTSINAEFSGGGDEGSINSPVFTGGPIQELADKEGLSITGFETDAKSMVEDFISAHINFDWYNNEGGGGDITINVETGEIEITGYYYEQTCVEVPAVTVNVFKNPEILK
jgi:hypothetical protein